MNLSFATSKSTKVLRSVGTAVVLGSMFVGCSQLEVRKLNPACKNTAQDYKIKGFRYSLGRPYILVKKQIVVATEITTEFWRPDQIPKELKLTKRSLGGQQSVSLADWQGIKANSGVGVGSTNKSQSKEPTIQQVADSSGGGPSATYIDFKDGEIPDDTKLTGSIEVVFLPDADEQYAVHHKNILAAGAYKLIFKDGWQLESVDGEFDSTTVAVELVKTVEAALQAAKKGGAGDVVPATRAMINDDDRNLIPVKITRTRYISPGLYRVNKPWEIHSPEAVISQGLLTNLGLEILEAVQVELVDLKNPAA